MVDSFQKQYESLKVAYPVDNVTSQVVAQEKEVKNEISSFVSASKGRIDKFEGQISHLKGLLPYEQMTMEDYRDAFPEVSLDGIVFSCTFFFNIIVIFVLQSALDPINRPTFWPHGEEDQVGYESAEQKAAKEAHH
jgi:F-type H+-transporting ATPase subunit d